jgi:hypothetical protein
MGLMNYDWLRQTSAATELESDLQLGGFNDLMVPAMDCLLKFQHWTGVGPSSQATVYTYWAMGSYVNAPYTFSATCRLSRSGFYLESSALLRHLSEVLVQLAYFSSRPQDAVDHFVPAAFQNMKQGDPLPTEWPKHNNVKFRTMFDALAPDYYKRYYSLASTFAHGTFGSHLFRVDDKSPAEVVHGCKYNDANAMFICNQAFALMYGFLHWFPQVFPTWDAQAAASRRDQQITAIGDALNNLWVESPQSKPWLIPISGLIGWTPPVP